MKYVSHMLRMHTLKFKLCLKLGQILKVVCHGQVTPLNCTHYTVILLVSSTGDRPIPPSFCFCVASPALIYQSPMEHIVLN